METRRGGKVASSSKTDALYVGPIIGSTMYEMLLLVRIGFTHIGVSLVPRPLFFRFCLVTAKKGSGGSPQAVLFY